MMENKVDLSGFLHKPEDYSHIDIMGEAMRSALNRVAELNEKTAEQVVILKQQEKINLLQRQNDELVARVARLTDALKYLETREVLHADVEYGAAANNAFTVLNEAKSQSLQHIQAEAVERVLDECAWYHDREFIKIDELIAYADKLRQQSTNYGGKYK